MSDMRWRVSIWDKECLGRLAVSDLKVTNRNTPSTVAAITAARLERAGLVVVRYEGDRGWASITNKGRAEVIDE